MIFFFLKYSNTLKFGTLFTVIYSEYLLLERVSAKPGGFLKRFELMFAQVDFTAKPVFWKDLTAPLKDKCGHLLTSLSYNPMTNHLTLGIIEARNLKAMDINGKSGKRSAHTRHKVLAGLLGAKIAATFGLIGLILFSEFLETRIPRSVLEKGFKL